MNKAHIIWLICKRAVKIWSWQWLWKVNQMQIHKNKYQMICRRNDSKLWKEKAIISHRFLRDCNAISTLRKRDSNGFKVDATSHENLLLKQFCSEGSMLCMQYLIERNNLSNEALAICMNYQINNSCWWYISS